jgi:PhoPQ-activated pathogenicity-related protein
MWEFGVVIYIPNQVYPRHITVIVEFAQLLKKKSIILEPEV